MSSEDIDKGERWLATVTEKLDDTSEGIVCVTPDNIHKPWINFEAGALAKSREASVRTLLLGVSPSDVTGPLSTFQHTEVLNQSGVRKMVDSINKRCDRPLSVNILDKSFARLWPELLNSVEAISISPTAQEASKRSADDVLSEIVLRLRGLETRVERVSVANISAHMNGSMFGGMIMEELSAAMYFAADLDDEALALPIIRAYQGLPDGVRSIVCENYRQKADSEKVSAVIELPPDRIEEILRVARRFIKERVALDEMFMEFEDAGEIAKESLAEVSLGARWSTVIKQESK